jgi:hypothetical protein
LFLIRSRSSTNFLPALLSQKVKPQARNGLAPFRKIAALLTHSEAGLAQVHHVLNGETIDRIFHMIVKNKKDVPANTKASLKWFREQPDFAIRTPYYINKWFGKFYSF